MEKVAAGTTGSSQKKCTMDFSKTLIKSGWRGREKAPVGSTANLFLLFYQVFLNHLKAPLNELAKLSGKPLEGLLGNMRLLECAQISKQRRWGCFDSDG